MFLRDRINSNMPSAVIAKKAEKNAITYTFILEIGFVVLAIALGIFLSITGRRWLTVKLTEMKFAPSNVESLADFGLVLLWLVLILVFLGIHFAMRSYRQRVVIMARQLIILDNQTEDIANLQQIFSEWNLEKLHREGRIQSKDGPEGIDD